MQRLLGEVVRNERKRRYRGPNGLEHAECRTTVRVVGSAVEALAAPDRVVGRETTVRRDCVLPWTPKKGDLIVLGASESARILRRRSRAGAEQPTGGVLLASRDVDVDGFEEDVLSNAFVTAAVQAHRGARLLSLAGADGTDLFARPEEYTMAGKYVLLGGAELVVSEAGNPGEIWRSAFDREEGGVEGTGDEARGEVSYSRRLKNPAGVRVEKTVRLDVGLPVVMESYTVRYLGKLAGKGEDGSKDSAGSAKDSKDEQELTLAVRMSTALLAPEPSLNVFELPCSDGVHLVRYHKPGFGRRWRWRDWRDEHFGLRGGVLVVRWETSPRALVVLFSQRRAAHVSVRSDYPGPEVSLVHRTRKLKKGRSARMGVAYVAADAVDVGRSGVLAVARGRGGGGREPVSVLLRASGSARYKRASVEGRDGTRGVTLRRLELPEAGHVYAGTVELPAGAAPVVVRARAGDERLELELGA